MFCMTGSNPFKTINHHFTDGRIARKNPEINCDNHCRKNKLTVLIKPKLILFIITQIQTIAAA